MEDEDVDAWRMMLKADGEEEDVDFATIAMTNQLDDYNEGVLSTIDTVVAVADRMRTTKMQNELDERRMVKSNHMVTLNVMLHNGDAEQRFRVSVVASAHFGNVQKAVAERLSIRWNAAVRLRLSWLKSDGVLIELNQATWRDFTSREWCNLPWVVHAHDVDADAEVQMPLTDTARTLFERYDLQRNGVIERAELLRMLHDVRLERFQCSNALVEQFAAHEFARLDLDGSGGVTFDEFTKYVTKMTAWMRMELLELHSDSAMFETLAGTAVEGLFPPTQLPNDDALDDEREYALIRTNCFGIKLEVPMGALPETAGLRVSVRTLLESSVRYLGESGDVASPVAGGALPFSPVVRVDCPAFANGEPPELGSPFAPRFNKPLTLVIPHCFDAREGEEPIAMIAGAPHGATSWEHVAYCGDDGSDTVQLAGHEMRVKIPYAGVFAAFARQSAQAVVFAARFHVFAMGELPRSKPSTLRVHLCPEVCRRAQAPSVSSLSRTHTQISLSRALSRSRSLALSLSRSLSEWV